MNHRHKKMGYSAAQELIDRMDKNMSPGQVK